METIRETVDIPGLSELFPAQYFEGYSWAVLDIETLGLSAARCPAILAGTVRPDPVRPDRAVMCQYFAEHITGSAEESALLTALAEDTKDTDILVTFNGQSFDIPFLRERYKQNDLPLPARKYSLDLYRVLRDCSDIGGFLPNLKQTTVEDFAGLWEYRSDKITGAKSISRYYDYLTDPVGNADAKADILLHNRDDIFQLYRLTALLKKADMHKACYRFGFPYRADNTAYLVKVIDLKKTKLIAEGLQTENTFDYIHYGADMPSYQTENGRFAMSIPLLTHENLVLADIEQMEEPPLGIPEEAMSSGYLVLGSMDEDGILVPHYRHCNQLVAGMLARIGEIRRRNL